MILFPRARIGGSQSKFANSSRGRFNRESSAQFICGQRDVRPRLAARLSAPVAMARAMARVPAQRCTHVRGTLRSQACGACGLGGGDYTSHILAGAYLWCWSMYFCLLFSRSCS